MNEMYMTHTHSQIINNLHTPLTKKNVNLCKKEK